MLGNTLAIWHGVGIWYGMVRYGTVWNGVAIWHNTAWYGRRSDASPDCVPGILHPMESSRRNLVDTPANGLTSQSINH